MTHRPQALQLVGIVAAVVLAFLVNVLAARHFTRWDWTRDKRWTLSPATLETLHSLEQPVEIWVIAGAGDPLEHGLAELLASYRTAASRIDVHWIDPDRDVAQLVALQARFGLEAGKTEDGRVATDAVVVVASADKHWFLTAQDLFSQADDDVHVKPREERAVTQAIRSVLEGQRAKLCFTVGHGELSLEPERDERGSLGALKDLLQKSNYELASVDLAAQGTEDPLAACTVAIIAGMRAPFASAEARRLSTWLLGGGALLAVVGPLDPIASSGMPAAGLDDVLGPLGIGLDDDLVHDVEPSVSIPDTHGEGFFLTVRNHPIAAALVGGGNDSHPPKVATFFARSLRHVAAQRAVASDLLVTSDSAFAKVDIADAATWTEAPPRAPNDPKGPFVVAMASEGAANGKPRGPRLVVLGSRFFLAEDNWRQPRPLHGAAFLVDSALSWLAARPEVIDVPDRTDVAAGMRISEAARSEVQRYVLIFMPLAALLMGASVWGWRRSSENKPYERRRAKEPPS